MRYHLDKRAPKLLAEIAGDDDDQLLSTPQVSDLLNISTQWLEIARHKGTGPRFVKIAPRYVRYRMGDIRAWISSRIHAHTKEYEVKRDETVVAINTRSREVMAQLRAMNPL